ncbi:hypothetical protein OGAPHI_006274 [Ogataea philodendri]|uniref:Uncharacterized protein n=1 Tax=Ogataea philodendri TaxID=1378263 RepID=A0A9P8NXI4_9ASCO|nr:uncharacterized protein OGAPHI_006274 [Ogataea philodendri]KAH3662093.1 hypothetical protein OGAPHI_006274 [Ogataea philodendri]
MKKLNRWRRYIGCGNYMESWSNEVIFVAVESTGAFPGRTTSVCDFQVAAGLDFGACVVCVEIAGKLAVNVLRFDRTCAVNGFDVLEQQFLRLDRSRRVDVHIFRRVFGPRADGLQSVVVQRGLDLALVVALFPDKALEFLENRVLDVVVDQRLDMAVQLGLGNQCGLRELGQDGFQGVGGVLRDRVGVSIQDVGQLCQKVREQHVLDKRDRANCALNVQNHTHSHEKKYKTI